MCTCKVCGCQIPDGHAIATQVAMRISAEETNAACEIAQAAIKHYMANCNDSVYVYINLYLDDAKVLSAVSRKYILRQSVQRHAVSILTAKNWKLIFSGFAVTILPIAPAPATPAPATEPPVRGTIGFLSK